MMEGGSLGGGSQARFALVVVVGMIVDLAASLALHRFAAVPLTVAAPAGFAIAATGNYLAHEHWTFAGRRGVSLVRGGGYAIVVGITLLVRLAGVAAGSWLIGTQGWRALAVLVGAAGVSFAFHYGLSRALFERGVKTP